MTQKDQRNHYNVKFLKGYGFSVKLKNNKVVLKNAYDPFKEPETEIFLIFCFLNSITTVYRIWNLETNEEIPVIIIVVLD